jgi:hypothetical protein
MVSSLKGTRVRLMDLEHAELCSHNYGAEWIRSFTSHDGSCFTFNRQLTQNYL